MTALTLKQLEFRYPKSNVDILSISDFKIPVGEKIFLYGPSGSGKTTLLSLIGGLFLPSKGSIELFGKNLVAMTQSERDRFRATELGFLFQVFNLVPYLSVVENVLLPCKFGRRISKGFDHSQNEAEFLLKQLGISDILHKPVFNLSIGQQQRVAAARALIGSPSMIIADEPTSALDADAREDFLDTLFAQAKREGSTVLFVSHDRSLAKLFDKSFSLPELNKAYSRSCSEFSESRREELKKRSLLKVNEHFSTTSNAKSENSEQDL